MSPEVIRSLGWDLISGSANAAVLGIFVLECDGCFGGTFHPIGG